MNEVKQYTDAYIKRATEPNRQCTKDDKTHDIHIRIRDRYCPECLIDELLEGIDIYKKNARKQDEEINALKRALGMDKIIGAKPNHLGDTPKYDHGRGRLKEIEI